MKMDRILVPVDGAVLAEQAVYKAAELAEAVGGTVILLRVAEAHEIREAQAYVTGLARRLAEGATARPEAFVWSGPVATCIVEAARSHAVDLIVMTSHGRRGLGRLLKGSVAESVARNAAAPVLLLHDAGAAGPAPQAQLAYA